MASSPTRFMDYQVNTYGMPRRRAVNKQPTTAPQIASAAYMPNGQPIPQAPPTQQPQTPQQPPQDEGMQYAGHVPGSSFYEMGAPPQGDKADAPGYQPPAPQYQPQQPPQPVYTPQPAPQPQPQAPQPIPFYGQPGTVNSQGVYTAGQVPQQVYQQQTIPQWLQPKNPEMDMAQQQNIMGMLGSGGTMNPQVVAQLQGKSRDQAALMLQQQQGLAGASMARRGMGDSSRYNQATAHKMQSESNRGLLDQFRNIDIQAADKNRADQLAALGAADNFQNNQMSRASTGYGNTLAGLGQNRTEQQSFLDSLMSRYGLQEDLLGRQASTMQSANSQAMQANQQSADNSHWADQMELNYRQQQQNEYNTYLQYMMSGLGAQ